MTIQNYIDPHSKLTRHLNQVKDFPPYLLNDQLLMYGDFAEVDPRNWKAKNLLDVFLFEEFIVFTMNKEYNDIR